MKPLFAALLVLSAAMLAAGQTLFRLGALKADRATDILGFIKLFTQPVIILALILYCGTTMLYVGVLQYVPVSKAYPYMALAFILVPIAAVLFLGETISLRYVIGVGLMIIGLLLTA
ncbi:EamA family transporter [Microvirga soli]|uniref:EamA family transporter n=1 Tax=Microvirga soli TaxID=1854496 RepID=UPI00191D0445|nr:EamA family transporter [Microvirga soli]